jgi:DNA-binding Xre family transcriptional regulator
MEQIQLAQRDLIRQMMDHSGLDATNLARAAGLTPSTVTRFMNRPVKHALSARTLERLRSASALSPRLEQPDYVSDQPDQVAFLALWEELNLAEKVATVRFMVATLRKPKRTPAS